MNRHNYNECVVEQLQEFIPNRIKILRQLPFRDHQGITEEQWSNFLMLNKIFFGENAIVENNEDMIHSYLMIDPSGRFFQNGNKEDYIYSDPIHEVGLEKALSRIKFSPEKFMSRYKDATKYEEIL